MKSLAIVILVLAILQADGRFIGIDQELPKVARETIEQSYACTMELGSKALDLPKTHGTSQELPEDNELLNELWGCIFVKKGLINQDNKINTVKLREYLMDLFTMFTPATDALRSAADDITQSCKDVQANGYQLKSVRLQNCISRLTRERGEH